MAVIRAYERAINSDRCPDAVAAFAVLFPIMLAVFAPVVLIAGAVR